MIVPFVVKIIVLFPMSVLESRIARRNEPGPASLVVLTAKVAAWVLATARVQNIAVKRMVFIFLSQNCCCSTLSCPLSERVFRLYQRIFRPIQGNKKICYLV